MGPGSAFRVSILVAGEGVSMCAYAYGCTRTCSYKPVYMCRRLQSIAVHGHKCLWVGLLFRPAGSLERGSWQAASPCSGAEMRWSNGEGHRGEWGGLGRLAQGRGGPFKLPAGRCY
ncbi:unnamed protein product [Rangifer tarandus platyrhynchus]|uniref:Uncharacterized protein n=1 Tax=Rangifer tarandus platyrhynchus TaxID=3082113 RepID=A0AC59YX33_RANTA